MKSDTMKPRYYYNLLSWPIGTLIVYGLFRNLLYENWLPKLWFFLNLKEGEWLNVSVSLIAVLCFEAGWASKKRHYSCHHIGLLLSIILLILLFYFDNNSIPYLQYCRLIPCWFVLLGSYLIGITVHYIYNRIEHLFHNDVKIEQLPAVQLIPDIPVGKISNDSLAYNDLAKRIASVIINNTWDESFSIGVTGLWGTGKTSMLLFVKDLLEKHDDIIIIEFNPRQSSSTQDIQKDFLNQLAEALGRYHSGAVRIAHRYMQAIGALPDSLWTARLFGVISDAEIEERRKIIVEVIKQIGKKCVVLIDDFDRLSGDEIQEVLKLIGKNAAFPKTFFVTAYDKRQTNSVISNYMGHVVDEETVDYTDKYFNIEVSLPKRQQSNYVKVLRECLYVIADNKIIRFGREEIDDALPKLFPHISKSLPTIRDIKRYVNLISLTLPPVEDDVLLEDFMLVTLIRYKYPEEYKKLSMYGHVVREGRELSKSKCLKLNADGIEKVGCADILKSLFPGTEPKYKSVSHVNSFTNYFYEIDSGHLPYRELKELLNPSITPEEFRTTVKALVKNDYEKSDFVEFVLSFEKSIHNEQEASWYFRFFLMARTYCDSKDLYIATLSYLLKDNVAENVKQFGFEDGMAYIGFLKAVLTERYDFRLSIEALHDALHAVNSLDSVEVPTLVFTPNELMDLARKNLEKAINGVTDGEVELEEVFRAYEACVADYIKDNGESIDSVATEMLKSAIKDNPDTFLMDVLFHKKAPNVKSAIQFYMEKIPYKDLFKNTKEFERFINEVEKSEEESMMLSMSQYAELCKVQDTWEPTIIIKGDISVLKQHDYYMYNKLFEGESVDA